MSYLNLKPIIFKSKGICISDVISLQSASSSRAEEVIKFSYSKQKSKKFSKLYTYGFKVGTSASLDELAKVANRYSISGPRYRGGHRKGENIIVGSNIILIDCDEPGQAEAVESKIRHYNYVKIPSASNLTYGYKWHYIIPTTEPLSIYPAAMKWQIEQFFRQVGITDDMIDTTGSYDAVRQFAPAFISMTAEEADELSEINETDLAAPIIPASEIPTELLTAAAKSKSIKIDGVAATELPAEHLWFDGHAIAYVDAIKSVRQAYDERLEPTDKIIVSGFGCPNDNHKHEGDIKAGYGFAFVGSSGSVLVKCSGNACKDHSVFVVPEPLPVAEKKKITEFDLDAAPKIVKDFNTHWEEQLCNISSPSLQANWKQNFDAFDEIILRNQKDRPGKKICCPSPTGSGKTQQITHQAINLYESSVGTLIVVMRNADADIIASQIKAATHDDYVAVFHTSDVTVPGVRKAENPEDAQCLIISHEMFRRREGTITDRRDFIVIDEAINVINQSQLEEASFRNILKVIDRYGDKEDKRLQSEARMIRKLLDGSFDLFRKKEVSFAPYRNTSADKKLNLLHELEFHAISKLVNEPGNKISPVLSEGMYNQKIDEALRAKYTDVAKNLKYFFRQWAFFTRSGNDITLTTASELIPKKSIVIMDATASVNEIYKLYVKYQPKRMKVLEPIDCRDYANVNFHTVRSATGRGTLIGKDKEKASKRIKKLFDNIVNNSEPGENILLVSFLKLEAEMMTYAEGITDRKIHVNHWGNLTGTNKYQYCRRIFIYGLNHKNEAGHRSVHALAKSAIASFEDNTENKLEMRSLITSDLVAEVIQAINRIRCRRVIDADGNCDPVDVYMTLPAGFSDATTMMGTIKGEMTNINTSTWNIEKEDVVELARVYSIEAFIRQLEITLSGDCVEVSLEDVLNELAMTKKQYRDYIKNKVAFSDALDNSIFSREQRFTTGYRGKVLKTKTDWFVVGK